MINCWIEHDISTHILIEKQLAKIKVCTCGPMCLPNNMNHKKELWIHFISKVEALSNIAISGKFRRFMGVLMGFLIKNKKIEGPCIWKVLYGRSLVGGGGVKFPYRWQDFSCWLEQVTFHQL